MAFEVIAQNICYHPQGTMNVDTKFHYNLIIRQYILAEVWMD